MRENAIINRVRTRRRAHVLSCALVGVLASACAGTPESAKRPPTLPDGEVIIEGNSPKSAWIVVEPARATSERVIATLPAQVVPDETHTVRVTSPVLGRIVTVVAQPGDHVRAGAPLAELRSPDAAQASSDAAKAATVWATSRAALARATDLFEHNVIAARELEQARNDEAQARAEAARARARIGQLGMGGSSVSDVYVLRAPMAGVVIDRAANTGAEVRPDNGQSLFTISQLDDVWLSVSVPQRDASLVHKGAHVRFRTDAAPGHVFDARVSFVSDALDPASRTLTARAVVANRDSQLRVQTSGEAQLLVADRGDGVVIPTRALVTHGADAVVFIEVTPGHYRRRVVVVRDDDGSSATLSSGVAVGERVVTTGSLLLAGEADRAR